MDNKVRIGTQSDIAQRATDAEIRAAAAASDYTMIQRRIRTFFTEVSEVSFPATAPEWAPEWVEWLLTGTVPVVVVEEPAAPASEPEPAV